MNILVNGSSICRGSGSWPYVLQSKIPECNLVNLAQAGAGNTYIHEATLSEISLRPYDLVIVMWSYADRFDFRARDISRFADTEYTSDYQSRQNDWPEKNVYPVNDQDYVQKNWVFGCGYINQRKNDSVGRVLKEYYKETGPSEHMFSTLIKIISFQNTLKQLGVPYVFLNYRPLTRFERFENLYKLINWSCFYDRHIFTIAKQGERFDDTLHPLPECHVEYGECLAQYLLENGYVK